MTIVVQKQFPSSIFPWGTLAVNLLGCFLIGIVAGIIQEKQVISPAASVFILVGVLGGFTTYSAFAIESVALMQDGAFIKAALNTLAQVVLGFGAAFAGYALARTF